MWNDRVVGTGQDGQANYLHVLLQSRTHDHFRSLAQAGVNHFHACVAQSSRDDLRSPVVAVQTRFGDQHPDAGIHTLSWQQDRMAGTYWCVFLVVLTLSGSARSGVILSTTPPLSFEMISTCCGAPWV